MTAASSYLLFDRRQQGGGGAAAAAGSGVRCVALTTGTLSDRHGPFPLGVSLLHVCGPKPAGWLAGWLTGLLAGWLRAPSVTLWGERQASQSIIATNILCCSSGNNPAGIHCDLHLCAGFPLKLLLLLHTRTDNINTTTSTQHRTYSQHTERLPLRIKPPLSEGARRGSEAITHTASVAHFPAYARAALCICRCARGLHDLSARVALACSPSLKTCTSITPAPFGSQGRGQSALPNTHAYTCTHTHAHAPAPPRAAAAAAAAAVSATHRPDVAVRSRPQLARFVLLRIHPPPYIHHPHPPAAITHRRANETTQMAEQSGARPHRSSCETVVFCVAPLSWHGLNGAPRASLAPLRSVA